MSTKCFLYWVGVFILSVAVCGPNMGEAAESVLVPSGAVWSYDGSGNDLGTAWRAPSYNDSAWASGPAQLGYGDGDEATVLPSNPVRPCYYFRHSFSVTDPALFTALQLEVLRDDGCVAYLNGTEVARYNMPTGTITYTTWASGASEYSWDPPQEISNLLVAGNNVLAVEVHQASSTSTDVSLDLRLTGIAQVTVALNSPAANATDVAVPATLSATGRSPSGSVLDVAFYGRVASPPSPDFTIVVLPDIQKYTALSLSGTPAILRSQIDWILQNRDSLNVACVAQLGDISDNGDNDADESEWINATNSFYLLDMGTRTGGIPYGLAVGNHDQLVPTGDTDPTTLYNRYFGLSHFGSKTYFGGSYDGTHANNQYQVFSAGGLDFIVISLEYDATPDTAVLSWANGLLQSHPHHRGIVVTHYLLETTAAWGV